MLIGRRVLVAAGAVLGAGFVLLFAQLLGIERAGAANTKLVTSSTSALGANDTGVYPHSCERLGVQHGWHVTPVNYDPTLQTPTARNVTLQVVCGPEPGKLTPPHKTSQVNPGEVKTHVLTCPGRRQLIGGGFQRTTFVGPIRGALIREVSASVTVLPGQVGLATTPPCPGKRRFVFSGFTTFPRGSIFYAGGPIHANQSVTATGYNRSLSPATLTAEAYCMNVKARPKGAKR